MCVVGAVVVIVGCDGCVGVVADVCGCVVVDCDFSVVVCLCLCLGLLGE